MLNSYQYFFYICEHLIYRIFIIPPAKTCLMVYHYHSPQTKSSVWNTVSHTHPLSLTCPSKLDKESKPHSSTKSIIDTYHLPEQHFNITTFSSQWSLLPPIRHHLTATGGSGPSNPQRTAYSELSATTFAFSIAQNPNSLFWVPLETSTLSPYLPPLHAPALTAQHHANTFCSSLYEYWVFLQTMLVYGGGISGHATSTAFLRRLQRLEYLLGPVFARDFINYSFKQGRALQDQIQRQKTVLLNYYLF